MYVNKQTFNSHPEKTDTEKEMQSYLFLEKIGVDFSTIYVLFTKKTAEC